MSKTNNEIYSRLSELVVRRYRANAQKSLFDVYQNDPDFLNLDPETLEFNYTNRAGILAILNDPQLFSNLVDLFVNASLEFTYQNNQFVHLDQKEKEIFENIYRDYLLEFKTVVATSTSFDEFETGLTRWVKHHFLDLSANIARFFDPETVQNVRQNVILKRVVCSEYSPQLQLEVLGITPATLLQPVLDLGCGKSGRLVTYLRSQGMDASGVDRLVEPLEGLFAADWFNLPLTAGHWGTILSHMAFSNHFLFHHRYKNGQPEAYARQYMALLSALKIGGSFYYAPGLPFIERFLPPARYQVSSYQAAPQVFAAMGLSSWLDEDQYRVTRVIRRSM